MSEYESALAEPVDDATLALMEDFLDEKSTADVIKATEHHDEPKLRTALLRAWKAAQMGVSLTELRLAVREKDVDAALIALARGKAATRIRQAMEQHATIAFRRGVQAGARPLRELGVRVRAPLTISMGDMNPRAVEWARQRAGDLVKTDAATRERVKAIIESAVEDGIPPDDVASLIVEFIGLDDRRADALMSEALQMHAQDKVDLDVLTRRAEEMLMSRANTIARTEVLMATNAGQQAVWEHAKANHLIGNDMQKRWLSNPDCCAQCELLGMDDPIDIDDEFESDDDSVLFPPLHPNCRCTVGLASVKE